MSEQIEASSSAIIELTENIKDSIRKISSLNSELSSQLKTLGNTFRDDGYNVIQGYVKNSESKINEAVPDLKVVMKTLIEYAQLLKKSEQSIS